MTDRDTIIEGEERTLLQDEPHGINVLHSEDTIIIDKLCPRCVTHKPLAEFYRRALSKDGHQAICKACSRLATKAAYTELKDKPRLAAWASLAQVYLWIMLETPSCMANDVPLEEVVHQLKEFVWAKMVELEPDTNPDDLTVHPKEAADASASVRSG